MRFPDRYKCRPQCAHIHQHDLWRPRCALLGRFKESDGRLYCHYHSATAKRARKS
jgi:hypothetical protein